MFVTNSDGEIIVSNQNFKDVFGDPSLIEASSVSSMLGCDLGALGELPSWHDTNTLHLPDGQRREMSWFVSIIRDLNGSNGVRNFVILGLDITERREAELAIYQSGKLLTLGQMATGIAHELSQPLATLAIMLDNMEYSISHQRPEIASFRGQIAEMSAQVERASTIARHMRVYGHKSDGSLSVLDPEKIIQSVLAICKEEILSKGIDIRNESNVITRHITGNEILIEQILLNFIVNARDSIMSKGEGSAASDAVITISVTDEPDGFVGLCVQDTGTGLNEDVADKLFDPFFTTKPIGQGMGLGLALCLGMARDMNGSIEARNVENGAIFILKLPTATV